MVGEYFCLPVTIFVVIFSVGYFVLFLATQDHRGS